MRSCLFLSLLLSLFWEHWEHWEHWEFFEKEAEIELGPTRVELDRFELETGEVGRGCREVLDAEEDLEEGAPTDDPLGLEGLDECLEGDLLVGVGFEGDLASLEEDLAEAGVALEFEAQDQGVDQTAHDALALPPSSVGDGHADDDLGLVGVASKEDGEGGEERHEGRRTDRPTELGEAFEERGVEVATDDRAEVLALGGTWSIGWQALGGEAC